MEQLLSPSRVARLYGYNRSTVTRWLDDGKVFDPATIKVVNGRRRIPISEVNRVVKSGLIKTK